MPMIDILQQEFLQTPDQFSSFPPKQPGPAIILIKIIIVINKIDFRIFLFNELTNWRYEACGIHEVHEKTRRFIRFIESISTFIENLLDKNLQKYLVFVHFVNLVPSLKNNLVFL